MAGTNLKLIRGIFGALIVGALGFGATQAVASPSTAAARAACSREQFDECRATCWALYGRFARTTCVNNGSFGVSCSCAPPIFP